MLIRKMLRDMNVHKTQFISIFIMSILGVYIFAGVGSEWYGLRKTVNNYYKESNFSNVWIYGSDFTTEEVNTVTNVDGVTGIQRRLSLDSVVNLENSPVLTLHIVEEDKISKCILIEGEEFSVDKDGIWIDSLFAEARKIKVGDSISVTSNGISMEKRVMGTVMNPEYVYAANNNEMIPNHANFGFAYLSYKAFPLDIPISYNELLITTNNTNYLDMEEKIDKALNGRYSVFLSRNSMSSYMQFDSEIRQHKGMGEIFPIAFLAIAMLTILTTMARIVNNQRTQIGMLKAMGFKKRRIIFHYVSYGLWLSLAGSAIGAIAGPLTMPYLFYEAMQTTYTLPEWKPAISFSIVVMAVISVVVCSLATYLSCKNVLKDTPSQTLRPKEPKIMKQGILEKTKLWNLLGFNAQWNLRDIFRSKVRSIMAIIGVLGCTALLVCAFGMQDSFDDIINWNYKQINIYETQLNLSVEATTDQIQSIIDDYNGEAIMEGAIEIKANKIKKSGGLLVTDNVTLIRSVNANRNYIDLPEDGISISYKMAENLDVKVGDEITWHIYGDERWTTSTIAAIYRTPMAQGITMTKDTFNKLGYTFIPTSIISLEPVESEVAGVTSTWSIDKLTESYETMAEAMNILIYILIIGAIVLAVVVLYNLGILSFTERQRELATLKVIGFKTKKIRRLLLTQNMWLTAVGIVFGIPVGWWLIDYIFAFMGGTFDIMTVVSVTSLIYSIMGTFLLSLLVNRMFSGKLKRIDMVSSLKGAE
ncbi:MAG: transporter permease protein [Clostridiales bacterium]|nr:transporter permease protein [Clostridiales bacterium]